MKSQTTPARVSGTLDSLVRSLTIMQMEQIASKANQTKDAELRSAGLRMNHRLTAGDVRHILHAADYVANQTALTVPNESAKKG